MVQRYMPTNNVQYNPFHIRILLESMKRSDCNHPVVTTRSNMFELSAGFLKSFFAKLKPIFFLNSGFWKIVTRNRPKMFRKLCEAPNFSAFLQQNASFFNFTQAFFLQDFFLKLKVWENKFNLPKFAEKWLKNPDLARLYLPARFLLVRRNR